MAETKYTEEQLQNAEELVSILKSLPEEKRSTVVMMANSFIAGMEAQARLTGGSAPANA